MKKKKEKTINILDKEAPIGVFDSGVGGLTVFSEIKRILPNESIIYFGDTARVPYGPKSKPVIDRYSREIVSFLLHNKVKMIVIACNTSTAVVGKKLSEILSIPIIGVIEPACRLASSITMNGRIGVIGTRGTVKSRAYSTRLKIFNKSFEVFQKACPLFVPMAEEGWTKGEVPTAVAKEYLTSLKKKDIDTLILGCTQYPILRDVISKFMGPKVNIIDSATQTALAVKACLKTLKGISETNEVKYSFNCSDSPKHFELTGNQFLDFKLENVKKIKVWEYGTEIINL